MADYPIFSIIIPVKNEAARVKDCLESIAKLDYPQDKIEVVLADALSQDNTREIGEKFSAKLVCNDKQTVGPGRNVGFLNSKGSFLVFTDADCTLPRDYLKNSLKYFCSEEVAGIGGPAITPSGSSLFEESVKFIYELGALFCCSAHRERINKVKKVKDIPGCNSIYRREILEKVMPIDEKLLTAEDVDLNFRIRELGYKLLSVPDVVVFHHRRSSPRKFFKQIYRFAIGRLQVGKKNIKMLNITHILAGISPPLFILLFLVFYFINLSILYFLIGISVLVAVFIFLYTFFRSKSVLVSLNTIFALLIAISAWSLGFMQELFFPLKDVTGK